MANMISEWVRCPVCGSKTSLFAGMERAEKYAEELG